MRTKIFLIVIVLLGFVLRVWNVGSLPVILNRDEAALGYNALLLKETGKDEWGKTWPMALESFGDYKLVGYPIAVIGSFFVFGYTDFAVRFPSVLGGTLLIVLTYFFAQKILKFDKKFALLSAFVIAITPVYFFFSRMAFEANLALALFVGALILLFSKTSIKQKFIDEFALFLLFIAIFIYNTPLLLLPFSLPLLIFWRGYKKPRKWLLPVIGMCAVIAIGASTLLTLSKQKSGITIFTDETVWQQSVNYHNQFSGLAQKLMGNRVVFFGRIIAQNYVATFSPQFLVIRGGSHPWQALPGYSHLYWCIYILGIIGILVSIFHLNKTKILLLYLLFLSPLPAVITVDAPHATRSLLFFFIFTMFAIIGLQKILALIAKKWRVYGLSLFVTIISIEAMFYFITYFTQYPHESYEILQGGYAQKLQEVEKAYPNDKIAVVDGGGYQYILTAWYLQVSPHQFFATVDKHLPDKIGFQYGYKIGHYRFIASPNDRFADEKHLLTWDSNQDAWIIKK